MRTAPRIRKIFLSLAHFVCPFSSVLLISRNGCKALHPITLHYNKPTPRRCRGVLVCCVRGSFPQHPRALLGNKTAFHSVLFPAVLRVVCFFAPFTQPPHHLHSVQTSPFALALQLLWWAFIIALVYCYSVFYKKIVLVFLAFLP